MELETFLTHIAQSQNVFSIHAGSLRPGSARGLVVSINLNMTALTIARIYPSLISGACHGVRLAQSNLAVFSGVTRGWIVRDTDLFQAVAQRVAGESQ